MVVLLLAVISHSRGKSMGDDMKDCLKLEININKNSFSIGEEIKINYKIINIHKSPIVILKDVYTGYTIDRVEVIDLEGKIKRAIMRVIYERIFPQKEDFAILKPGEEFCTEIFGKIIEGKTYGVFIDEVDFKDISGIFVDFRNSAILIGEDQEFYIQGKYTAREYLKTEGNKRYGLTNIWSGEIKSNKLKFSITKQRGGSKNTTP